jgi:hypothetical protein
MIFFIKDNPALLRTDGMMIQMVQNMFDFFANTMFWLAYVPFYERLFPVFSTETPEVTSRNEFDSYSFRPKSFFGTVFDARNLDNI